MRRLAVLAPLFSFAPLALVGCTTDDPADPASGAALPHASGAFAGRYDVPTSPELAAAATFPVDHVDWTVANGVATLHYDLPLGLVGGDLSVTLTGPIEPGSEQITVTGPVGTGTCTAAGSVVTCREVFTNLGALPISTTVVEQRATLEYTGPLQDRLAVVNMFASEPIGIVIFDVQQPVFDDNGGED